MPYCKSIIFTFSFALAPLLAADEVDTPQFTGDNWPWWRGEQRTGHADPKQTPPTEWSATKHVVWKAEVPGRGHGSPIIVGNRVFLASADVKKQLQFVLCYDRATGEQLWRTDVHSGKPDVKNAKGSAASCTPACDGERVFVNFLNSGQVFTTALSLEGKQLWQTKITDYKIHQGYGSSPAIYGDLVIVSADNKLGGAVAALNRKSGDIVWKVDRPKTPNYPSPVIHNINGKDQLLMTGCDLVTSLNPLSGEKLWEIDGATTECVTTTVTDGKHVYSSGGYPTNHIAAIKADGSGEIAWSNNVRVYVPSMLEKDGYLYFVADAGVAMCLKSDTGQEAWKARLGGTFSSSPVLVGDSVYATNEAGEMFIFKATPEKFEKVAENQLGDEVLATPTIVGGRIYHRVATKQGGVRQEMLYCLGE